MTINISCWPVIVRELRAEARRPMNYWLRMFVVTVTLVAWLLFGLLNAQYPTTKAGIRFLHLLHVCLFWGIAILVPVMTADCISRERREGTLGLLFLTPLTASGVVVAKCFVHALRAGMLISVMIPLLTVPFLVGGVGWKQVCALFLTDFNLLLLALASSIGASALSIHWSRSLLATAVFMIIGVILVSGCFGILFLLPYSSNPRFSLGFDQLMVYSLAVFSSLDIATELTFTRYSPMDSTRYLQAAGWATCVSAGFLYMSARIASQRVSRSWQPEPLSPRALWWWKTFCSPQFWREFFQWRMTRALDRNPIYWLYERSWSGRLTKWGWCLVILTLDTYLVVDVNFSVFLKWQGYLALAVLVGMAFSAAGSFHQEKQNGALELLLVTPLRENQIIYGRLYTLWKCFFPSAFLLLLSWTFILGVGGRYNLASDSRIIFLIGWLTLPIVGLYWSLQSKNLLVAFLQTCIWGIVLPFLLTIVVGFRHPVFPVVQQLITGGVLLGWLKEKISARKFILS